MEALKRYRSGGEQKVTVQHVSVNEGGQAIVGNVTQATRETTPGKPANSMEKNAADVQIEREIERERLNKPIDQGS